MLQPGKLDTVALDLGRDRDREQPAHADPAGIVLGSATLSIASRRRAREVCV